MRMGGGLNFVAISRELGQKCLESARRELQTKSGADFDRCYVNMQVGNHMHMVDMCEVFRNHASESLRAPIGDALRVAQQHLQHAKELAKKVEGKSASGAGN
jgi:predicted outer membrane protein